MIVLPFILRRRGKTTFCADGVSYIYSVESPNFSNSHFSTWLPNVVPSTQSNTVILPPISRTFRFSFPLEVRKIRISLYLTSAIWQIVFCDIWIYVVDQQTKCFEKHRDFGFWRSIIRLVVSLLDNNKHAALLVVILNCPWFIFVNSFKPGSH